MSVFIDDGKTKTHLLDARPGKHPAVTVEYRRALAKERTVYRAKAATGSPDAIDSYERGLILKHVVSLDGGKLTADQVDRLHPDIRVDLIDLILSYTVEQEADEGKGSGGASG